MTLDARDSTSKALRRVTSRSSRESGFVTVVLQLHRSDRRRDELLVDPALQPLRLPVLGILGQYRAQDVLGFAVFVLFHQLFRRGDDQAVASVGLHLRQAGLGAHVCGVVFEHPFVKRFGQLELAGEPQRVRLSQPLRHQQLAQAEILVARGIVGRVVLERFLEGGKRLLAAAFVELLARVLDGIRRAGHEQCARRERGRHEAKEIAIWSHGGHLVSRSLPGWKYSVSRTWAST